jgi:hypothetical protein
VLRVRAGDAKTAASADISGAHWSSSCAPGLTCHLWIDRGARRVSEVVTVRAVPPRTGPITLVPIKRSEITIHWRNAPAQGSLDLVAVDPNHGVPTKTSIALNSSEGARACELFAGGGVAVRLVGPSGSVVNWSWAHSELSDPLDIDLGGDRASAVAVYANGDRPTGESHLTLVPLESNQGAGHCFATLTLENGVSTETIPLFSGPIYYRLDAKGLRAAVCGVLRADDARPDHRLTIEWTGAPTALSEFGAAGQGGLELVSWDGNKLDAVAKTLRRFRMSELLGEGQNPLNRTSSVTVNTSQCRFNVFP